MVKLRIMLLVWLVGFEETLKCQYVNGGCEQFCDDSGPRRKCSCPEGYSLGADGISCVAEGGKSAAFIN